MAMEDATREELARLRQDDTALRGYGMEPWASEQAVVKVCLPMMNAAGLRLVIFREYRMFVREMSRVVRRKRGHDLATELELLVLKWVGIGLEPGLVERLVRETCYQLSAQSLTRDRVSKTPVAGVCHATSQ